VENKKVLLADDVELFLELEKTFFRREGFELLVARSGREAYDMVLTHRPDLVFMDLFMPEMNGDESCRLIKAHAEVGNTPVVMVTHGGRDEDLQCCRDAGCDDIVLKPINRHHFLSTARKYLNVVERAAPRVQARLRVQYGSDGRLLTHYSVNLSSGGVFIETPEPLPAKTALSLEFDLPALGRTIRCKGRVAWINHPEQIINPQLPSGMGLQFLDLSLEDLTSIREYVKKEYLHPSW